MNAYPENFARNVAAALGLNPDHSGTARLAADLAKPEKPLWPEHTAKPMCREASMRRQMAIALRECADRLAALVTDQAVDQTWEDAAWDLSRATSCIFCNAGIRYCMKVADALGGLTTDELLSVMRYEADYAHWEVAAERIRQARKA